MANLKYSDGTESSQTTASGGLNFLGALALLFIGLKLTGFISWSWLWVLSPIWMPFAVVVALAAIIGTGALIVNWAAK